MNRFAFIARRLLFAVPLLLVIVFLVFMLLQITPGDPARAVAGLRASEADLRAVRHQLGLDDSVFVRFLRYVNDLLHGNLGYSFKSSEPVSAMIGERFPITAWLLVSGILLSLAISIPAGILSARRERGFADTITRSTEMVGLAMPSFWVGIVLVLTVALPTGALPAGGFGEGFGGHLRSIVLPALTLAISVAPLQIRSLRASVLAVRGRDYVTMARTLGISERRVTGRFVLRNAAGPSVSLLALNIGFLLFDAVIIESTFALPGLGQGIVLAAKQRDIPAIQGYTLLFAVIVVLVYLAADIVNAALDPRMKVES
ncbi:ABC transporter permease [Sciscionella sediminilitoris]|uniref:ABC transporter permease n=1 Tax=Sciscionella sediminilitoris TaxID=1445613 RepID=UPI0004DF7CD1|nr:ABC transporter permease [Sciscionella sp. SE31]